MIDRPNTLASNTIGRYTVTFGNDADVTLNPVCVPAGTMNSAGWYLCPTSMTGIVFGIYSIDNSVEFAFMEAMAYSQEAI